MLNSPQIKDAAHNVRNNVLAFEMALDVLEQAESNETRNRLITILKNEIDDTKKNLEHFIGLVESDLGSPE